ncbi:MAG: hypothetical protein NW224_07210 [Leptolyngbyaceae cyanobacterium bins.302]|nr:hypothetical protein [Leptolyngbyaceae cyanobacterium bins.302]
MRKTSSPKKDHRLLFIISFCAISGAILNSSTAWAESTNCLQSENPPAQCVRKSPMMSAIEGGVMGVMAGTGAALGAVLRRYF